MELTLTAHGAGQEVGRSCIDIQAEGKRFIFDAGIKINKDGNEFPTKINKPRSVNGLFLSHAHMDHSGALPLVYHFGVRCPYYTTPCTKAMTKILLRDSWKIDRIENRKKVYERDTIRKVLDNMVLSTEGHVAGCHYRMIPTGHIPSSKAILLNIKGKRILYSGDVNGAETHLIHGVTTYPKADVLILESTYGNRGHPDRQKTESNFIEAVKATLKMGGTVLCPSFAVGRAQELMILLNQANLKVPIYLDGMSKKMLNVFLEHDYEIKDNELAKAAKRVEPVNSWKMRAKITKKPCVIIATAGMMDGGPVIAYAKQLYSNHKNAILLSGYQAEKTNGRRLLEQGMLELDNRVVRVKAYVEHFDLSAHASQDDLHKIIESVQPKHLILNHGDEGPEQALAEFAKSKGIKAHLPATGQTIKINM